MPSNKLLRVKFWDHAFQGNEPILCEVAGWLIEETNKYLVLSCWITHTDDREVFNNNLEKIIILKSCIKSKRVIS